MAAVSRTKKNQKKVFNTQISKSFYSDTVLDDMIYAVIIRTPVPKGRIKKIFLDDIPEGYYLITAENFPGRNSFGTLKIQSEIFCSDEILYTGQAAGILCGPDEKKLNELKAAVQFEIDETVSEEANIEGRVLASRIVRKGKANYSDKTKYKKEDFEKLFTNADFLVENNWSYLLNSPSSLETNGALCSADKKGITIYTPTQWPRHLMRNLSEVFSIDENNIYIKKTISSSPHTNSLWGNTLLSLQTTAASIISGKPVKLVLSREEHKQFVTNKGLVYLKYKSAVSKEGKITGQKIEISFDAGAVNPFAAEIIDRLAIAACSIYDFQNIEITAIAFSTKNPPSSINIETIDSQAFYAVENQMQKICAITGFSPLEIRFKNSAILNSKSSKMPFTINIEKGREAFEAIARQSDLERKFVTYRIASSMAHENAKRYKPYNIPLRGIGLSCAFDGSGYFGTNIFECNQEMELTLETDGTLTIHAVLPSETILEIWKSSASEILGIEPKMIKVNSDFETKKAPFIPENFYSNISIMNQLLKKCCQGIQSKRFRMPLPIKVSKGISAAQKKQWNNDDFKGLPFHSTSFITAALELEFDPCSFKARLKNIWIVISAGKILLGKPAETRIKLSIHQVLSQIVENEMLDCAKISVSFVQSESEPAQIGGLIKKCLPAAFSSALSQALGSDIPSLPIKTDSLFKIISQANTASYNEPAVEKQEKDAK